MACQRRGITGCHVSHLTGLVMASIALCTCVGTALPSQLENRLAATRQVQLLFLALH